MNTTPLIFPKKSSFRSLLNTHKKTFLLIIHLILSFLFCLGFDYLFENVYCDFLFKCGCTWNWAGGWDQCNIFNEEGPHCPFCNTTGDISSVLTWYYVLMYLTYWSLWVLRWPRVFDKYPVVAVLFRGVVACGSYFVWGLVVAYLFKVASGYPHFIFE
eukprot:TRINITY_DN3023_c0_g1_i1.p1 TRINITY_DN3023_c0_g1~~TRINITY_DN3023_c0_g1_i1.p1  ORF type:complete len:158 (+),score=10.71 TRINITY_DN3023_c0_g1_i1:2-475(+)